MLTRFWAEVVYYLNYLLNMILNKYVWDMNPLEKWSGRKPSIKHLKIVWMYNMGSYSTLYEKEVGCEESCLNYGELL
jgi:hypothetical protein